MRWLNKPEHWKYENGLLALTAEPKTDFWRKTHYGFIRDSGHFFFEEVTGDFEIETRFQGDYHDLYDQAGLMIRADETTWLKTGIEFVHGVQHLSVVVTRDFSDWSVVPLLNNLPEVRLRVKRSGGSVVIDYTMDDEHWIMLRTAYLSAAPRLEAGVMAAAPDGSGFEARFRGIRITNL
jgi:regulation of enolase protein 1 (concanavalin A-like superfamily)